MQKVAFTLSTPIASPRARISTTTLFSCGNKAGLGFAGGYDPEGWGERQKIANAKRAALDPILQFYFPLKGKKVGIEGMQRLEGLFQQLPGFDEIKLGRVDYAFKRFDSTRQKYFNTAFVSRFYDFLMKHEPIYVLCKQALEKAGPNPPLTEMAVLAMLKHLQNIGVDGGELHGLMKDMRELQNKFAVMEDEFPIPIPLIQHYKRKISLRYFEMLSTVTIKNIELMGKGITAQYLDPSVGKFYRSIASADFLSEDVALYRKLHQVCRLRSVEGTSTAYQYPRIVHLAYGLTQTGGRDKAMTLLDEMLTQKTADFKPMAKAYLQQLAEKVGYPGEFTEADAADWNLGYVHCFASALTDWDASTEALESRFSFKDLPGLEALLRVAFNKTYQQWLHSPETPNGRANLKTQKVFQDNRLDYKTWLHYSDQPDAGRHYFTLPDGRRLFLKVWDRHPGYDLFQGNYAQSCSAINGDRGYIAIDDLQYTVMQVVELKDADTRRTVGNAMVYWAKDLTGPFLVVDNVQLQAPYRENQDVRNGMTQFLADYAQAVAGKPVPVRVGRLFNRIPLDGLAGAYQRFEVLGDTPTHTYQFNSLIRYESVYDFFSNPAPQKLSGTQNVKLYDLFLPDSWVKQSDWRTRIRLW